MDKSKTEQQSFDAVWSRVTAAQAEVCLTCAAKKDDNLLGALITAEASNGAYYAAAAKSLRPCDTAAFFRSLSEGCETRLGKLQTLYFLLNGNSFSYKTAPVTVPKSSLMALRDAYWREAHAAAALDHAAHRSDSAKLSEPLLELAGHSRQRSRKIFQRIQQCLC